jgi:hypothetical protein
MEMKNKESYKHKMAKEVLAGWLRSDYAVNIEQEFINGGYPFRPDISVYSGGQLQAFYEVVHKSDPSGKTIGRMQMYYYMNNIELLMHVVDAEYILCQCVKPENIFKISCELSKT